MAQLPPLTRAAIVGRYILDTPLPDLATRLGLTEAATAKRIQRGACALRASLEADRQQVALESDAAFGSWQHTRIWCIYCGRRRLLGRLSPERTSFSLRCPGCRVDCGIGDIYIQHPDLLRGVTSLKPAFSRVLAATHRRYRDALAQPDLPCLRCKRPTPLHIGPDDDASIPGSSYRGTVLVRRCGACGSAEQTSLSICAFALPPVQRFWRDHPRLVALPERVVEAAGRRTVVITFQGVGSADQIDVLAAPDTGRVLALNGCPYRE
jgi:hypothetical protein